MRHLQEQTHHNGPVQEILGAIPSWIIRWGVTVIAAVFALIVIGCCIIKYPQTIVSAISIISTNPPSQLEARYSGIIDTIAVINGQAVKQGDLIALLKTPAEYGDIMTVKSFVEQARNATPPEIADNQLFEATLALGSLQDKWTELRNLSREYSLYVHLDQIGKRRSLLSEQIEQQRVLRCLAPAKSFD